MRRLVAFIALFATACTTMEPKYVRPTPAIPASWPVGDPYLVATEVGLPALTYKQVFLDPRLQTLIAEAINNNQNLRVAAANVAVAREQYRIQHAQEFPVLNATGGVSGSGGSDNSNHVTSALFEAGLQVPSFEVDLFGRLRSLTDVQLNHYFSTEAGARATRLTLVANVANEWLSYASDSSLLAIYQQTVTSALESVRLTRLRLEGGIAPRTDLDQAQQIYDTAEADLARQRTTVAQDENALRLLVGGPVDPSLLVGSIDQALGSMAPMPTGLNSYVLLRRPDVVQAEYDLKSANANIGAARAALFPKITLTGLLGFASSALLKLFTGAAFGWSAGADATYTIFQAGAGHANLRMTEAQQRAALATYEGTIQTAFREVSDALARRGTINDEIAAQQRQQAETGDAYLLGEDRYRAGIDPFLNVLEAQRSYYTAQQALVSVKLAAGQNIVTTYQTIGGDTLLEGTPICQKLPGDTGTPNAVLGLECLPE